MHTSERNTAERCQIMTFIPNTQLDPSQVEDRRDQSSGFGGGYGGMAGGFGRPIVVGGGGVGLLLTIIIALNVFDAMMDPLTGPSSSSIPSDGSRRATTACRCRERM